MSLPCKTDDAAQQNRVVHHLGYVMALARRIHRGLPEHVDLDDLVQYGRIGLVEAAASFDPRRGIKFTTFAYPRIRGAILDGLARLRGISRRMQATIARESAVDSVAEQITADITPEMSAGDLARRFRGAVRQLLLIQSLSDTAEEPCPSDENDDDDPAEAAVRKELRQRLPAALSALTALERDIVRLHYWEGLSFSDCARRLGKHKAWIGRLHVRALEKLHARLGESAASAA
jgi:RNA polymerase sigma factor for flagellar operon FliA